MMTISVISGGREIAPEPRNGSHGVGRELSLLGLGIQHCHTSTTERRYCVAACSTKGLVPSRLHVLDVLRSYSVRRLVARTGRTASWRGGMSRISKQHEIAGSACRRRWCSVVQWNVSTIFQQFDATNDDLKQYIVEHLGRFVSRFIPYPQRTEISYKVRILRMLSRRR